MTAPSEVHKPNSRRPTSAIALREWTWLSLILVLLTVVLISVGGLKRFDQTMYDRLLQSQSQPARDDIIIVAIDDYSLSELGKWPWPRARHAELLRQLHSMQVKAIGFDILFAEEETNTTPANNGDLALAQELRRQKNVVLPLVSIHAGKGLQAAPPLALLAQEAAALGHIHIELDDDGVARSVFLKEGIQGQWWPHFSLALHDVGKGIQRQIGNEHSFARTTNTSVRHTNQAGIWQRDFHMQIPFYGGSGKFTSVPYVAVLRGEVPASFFQNKYVLVGPTAQGMADAFPTPVTSNEGILSGVEINANILASLLDGRSIVKASWWQCLTAALLTLGIALLSFLLLSPRMALLTVFVLIVLQMIGSYVFLMIGYWLPPSSTLIVLVIAYPLWSWRRLEAAISFLGEEFILLDQEPHLLPELQTDNTTGTTPDKQSSPALQDKLERHFNAMRTAARRVRDLRQFVTDSLYGLPDATVVTTRDGTVVISNPAASTYFNSIGVPHIIDTLVPYLFANMSAPHTEYASQRIGFSWWHILDLEHTQLLSKGVEVVDPQGRNIIIKSAPCYSSKKELVAWIISLIDISEIRQAERRRDETLHFISHDMRAPQSSILALIELQKDPKTAITHSEFLERIEKASTTTLGLADNFVQLAHAESNEYRLSEVDFQDLLIEASEEMWALARSKRIKISTIIPEGVYPVRVDRSLMTRVLTNLLSNAIKYSPSDTTVTCTLSLSSVSLNDSVICTIQDQGYGIARADQSKLFQRFQRINNKAGGAPKSEGLGLGMVFVKTVIDRHYAQIRFHSVPGEGTLFTLQIPASLVR